MTTEELLLAKQLNAAMRQLHTVLCIAGLGNLQQMQEVEELLLSSEFLLTKLIEEQK
jgi:hypothetical protein